MKRFVLAYDDDGSVAGIDQASGGYHYKAGSVGAWAFFNSIEEAADYASAFNPDTYGLLEIQQADICVHKLPEGAALDAAILIEKKRAQRR